MDEEQLRLLMMARSMTPFLYGALQGSVEVIPTPYGYEVKWGGPGVPYAYRVNRTSKLNAGYMERVQAMIQSMTTETLIDPHKFAMDLASGDIVGALTGQFINVANAKSFLGMMTSGDEETALGNVKANLVSARRTISDKSRFVIQAIKDMKEDK